MSAAGELALIAALGRRREIGKDGALPWRLPEDLKRFKRLTLGHAVIMGRKTFESIGRALPERRNIVISRGAPALPPGVELAPSLEAAIALARETDPAPMVIGGGDVYRAALPLATRLHLTHVDREVDGADAFFPELPEGAFVIEAEPPAETEGVRFVDYRRADAPAATPSTRGLAKPPRSDD